MYKQHTISLSQDQDQVEELGSVTHMGDLIPGPAPLATEMPAVPTCWLVGRT